MPFYDLYCNSCKKESNVMALMADKEARRIPCPECGSTDMDTSYKSAPGVIKSKGDAPMSCPNRNVCGKSGGGCGGGGH